MIPAYAANHNAMTNLAGFERALGAAMLKHRVTVDGWDGSLWQRRKVPTGIVSGMCRLLVEMDGGSMWSRDLLAMGGDADRAIVRIKRKGLVDVIGFEAGKGELLMCNTTADDFLLKYDTGQGWLI